MSPEVSLRAVASDVERAECRRDDYAIVSSGRRRIAEQFPYLQEAVYLKQAQQQCREI